MPLPAKLLKRLQNAKPTVGISSCLWGNRVRYDGTDQTEPTIIEHFSEIVQWVALCPEVEIGLGVPRPRIDLFLKEGQLELRQDKTDRNLTQAMEDYSFKKGKELFARHRISGFLFKTKSPSCALTDGKYKMPGDRETVLQRGPGLFTKTILHIASKRSAMELPTLDEIGFRDPILRDTFFEKIVLYHDHYDTT
ncbi:MAG: DUF523 domain-containing protein [Pirellulaceae bacterium]|nr:DUF523 domain-containing protein [Pirellulaceae bacterium]